MTTPANASANVPERTLWQGSPSQALNAPAYVALGVGLILVTVALFFVRGVTTESSGTASSSSVATAVMVILWGVGLILAVLLYLRVSTTKYVITSERLRITTGMLSTSTEDIELRRARDSNVVRPFSLRMLGLGHVNVISDDRTAPSVTLRAIRDPDAVQTLIRNVIKELYDRYRVRGVDVL